MLFTFRGNRRYSDCDRKLANKHDCFIHDQGNNSLGHPQSHHTYYMIVRANYTMNHGYEIEESEVYILKVEEKGTLACKVGNLLGMLTSMAVSLVKLFR